MKKYVLCLVAPVLFLGTASAQEEPKWKTLTVQPAAIPSPALKYQLLPELRDMTPGNAALLYQRAHSPEWWTNLYRHPEWMKSYEWLELPLKDFPRDKARNMIPGPALREVDLAARREYCDWELTSRLRKHGINLLIPDVQGFREYGRLLGFRMREEMLGGQLDKAIYTLQTGFAMSRHIADSPTLICALVGVAVGSITTDRVEELIQQPGAPNLYWALTDLPRPFFDLRKAFQGEKMIIDAHLPEIRKALDDPRHPPIPNQTLQESVEMIGQFVEERGPVMSIVMATMSARIYPEARAFLIRLGRSPEYVDSLPVVQVGLMYSLVEYDRLMDELYKWHSFPYRQGNEGVRQASEAVRESRIKQMRSGGISLASIFLPAVERVLYARERIDRRIAALRCVEAIRLYAVENKGRLPSSLADIKNVPIPNDPLTGRDFLYTSDGARARLSTADAQPDASSIRYEIVLQSK